MFLLLVALLLVPYFSRAEEGASTPESGSESDGVGTYLQASHDRLSERVIGLADAIDSIFGDRRATDEANKTIVRVSKLRYWIGRGEDADDLKVTLKLRLPRLERKGREMRDSIRFDKDPLDIAKKEGAERSEESEDEDEDKIKWYTNAEPGLRVGRYVDYFVKARVRTSLPLGRFVHHFSEELTWGSRDRWLEVTELLSDFALSDRWLFRFQNRKDWEISNHEFRSYHGPSLIRQIDGTSALSYDLRLQAEIENSRLFTTSYSAGINYRKAVLGKWMFFEVAPGLLFPREDRFKGTWTFALRLEALFGGI